MSRSAATALIVLAATGALVAQAAGGRGGQGRGGQPPAGRGGQPTPEAAGPPPAAVVGGIPNLAGIWDGGGRARPVNGENVPWARGKNFPELNERGLAFVKIFDEAIAPKYDCFPSTSPAIQYDPYMMEVVQWPDRVLLRYEKDDQLRTVWMDGRKPTVADFSIQGYSVGRYDGNALLVETTHFTFDITGFDDYNGIPSSQQKIVRERYWRDGHDLRVTVSVEDPMFLRKPAEYTTRWIAASAGMRLAPFECDPESARASIKFLPPRYK